MPDRLTKLEFIALGSILWLSLGLFLWGLNGDSPVCTQHDESFYAIPALQMVIKNDPNPHTFVNPASTLIYPLAAFYAILGRVTGTQYIDPTVPAWVLCAQHIDVLLKWPRLLNLPLLLASLVLTYLTGRAWVSKPAAMLGVAFLAFSPMIVYYAQILRPDTMADFFICLGMFLLGLVSASPANKKLAAALGICAGLAMSTRYFCAALLPAMFTVYVLGLFLEKERARWKGIFSAGFLCFFSWFFTFIFTSPFIFLDLAQTKEDLEFEALSKFSGMTGLGPLGNLHYYFTEAFPESLGTILMTVSGIGLIILLTRPNRKTIVYAVLLLVLLVGTCLNPRHWNRWVLPMLPIMCLLAAYAISCAYLITKRLLKRFLSENLATYLSFALWTAFTLYSYFFPFRHMLACQVEKGSFTGRAKVFFFIRDHIPLHSKIACDMSWQWPNRDDYYVVENIWRPDFIPPRPHNYYLPEDLAKEGFQFMIVERWNREDYSFVEADKYPREAKFYLNLRKHAPMLYTSFTKDRPYVMGERVPWTHTPVEVYDLRPLAEGKYPAKDYAPDDAY